MSELNADGVSTDYLIRAQGQPSPSTYIIVDREGAPSPEKHMAAGLAAAPERAPCHLPRLILQGTQILSDLTSPLSDFLSIV